MKLTNAMIDQGKTENGAWTRAQLALLGIEWPPVRGWKGGIIGMEVTVELLDKFYKAVHIRAQKVRAPTIAARKKSRRRVSQGSPHSERVRLVPTTLGEAITSGRFNFRK